MSAEALRSAVDRAQQNWARIIGREAGRAARIALGRTAERDELAQIVALLVESNVIVAGTSGVEAVSIATTAADLAPVFARPPDRPAIDVGASVARAWGRARLAASEGDTVHLSYLRSEVTRIVGDTLTEAFRDGMTSAMDAHPDVIGWRRVSRSGCCGACLALTDGNVFPIGARLAAHGRCRCVQEPVAIGVNDQRFGRPTGDERFAAMTTPEQDAMFAGHGGQAKADLVRSGQVSVADLVSFAPRPPGVPPVPFETPLALLSSPGATA